MGRIVLTKQAMAKKCDIILIKNSSRSLVLTFVCMCTSCNTVAKSLSEICGVKTQLKLNVDINCNFLQTCYSVQNFWKALSE